MRNSSLNHLRRSAVALLLVLFTGFAVSSGAFASALSENTGAHEKTVVSVGVAGHGHGLAPGQLLHHLGRGQVLVHRLVHLGRGDLKAPQPHLAQQLLPPGGLGCQNHIHKNGSSLLHISII